MSDPTAPTFDPRYGVDTAELTKEAQRRIDTMRKGIEFDKSNALQREIDRMNKALEAEKEVRTQQQMRRAAQVVPLHELLDLVGEQASAINKFIEPDVPKLLEDEIKKKTAETIAYEILGFVKLGFKKGFPFGQAFSATESGHGLGKKDSAAHEREEGEKMLAELREQYDKTPEFKKQLLHELAINLKMLQLLKVSEDKDESEFATKLITSAQQRLDEFIPMVWPQWLVDP